MTMPLPDSGLRVAFSRGGAHREADPSKPLLSAISPYAMDRLGLHLAAADEKYKDVGGCRNWEKGMPVTRYIDGIGRHLAAYLKRDASEDHLAAIMWGGMCLAHHEQVGAVVHQPGEASVFYTFDDLDDRPIWTPRQGETP